MSSDSAQLSKKLAILENLVGSLPDTAFIVLEMDGCVRFWSFGAEKLFGYAQDQIVGKAWDEIKVSTNLSFADIKKSAAPKDLNLQAIDGRRLRGKVTVSPVLENGAVIAYNLVIRDLSELKKTVEQLRRNEEDFGLMISAVKDYAIFALDPNGFITSWNEGARAIKGYDRNEIVGKHFSIFYSPQDRERNHPEEELKEAVEKGRYHEEGWRFKKDGSCFWADVTITAVKDENDHLRGFLKVTRDLTERRAAEEQLRRSDEVFDLMVSAVKDYAIFLLDVDGKILTWNAGAARFKGYTASEVIGKHFSIFYPEDLKLIGHPDKELRQAKDNGHYEEEGWRVRKDGSTFFARVTITAVFDEHGEHRGFVKVTQDLTQQRLSDEEVRRARDEALRSSELKSQFVANVSHEIRTPMAGIIGMAELLHSDPELNEEQKELAFHLLDSGKRLLVVLNDILDFSKLEAGRVNLEVSEFSPRLLANEVCQSFISLSRSKDLDMILDIDELVPDRLLGDEVKIRQVLSNLVGNAVKFTKQGSIQLSVRASEGLMLPEGNLFNGNTVPVLFEVQDTGIGITEEQKARLFQPFIQADGSTRRRFGGTGLGLSISKGYVQLMHGAIDVESEMGKGSVFRFVVPLQKKGNS
ncbi:MAG: PAS domain S-box protein [Candidatus Obscuribacterales bacterium]|nr:PAS domain S-box protein [Candidatus Obscuribacterales bacterium]